MKTRKTNTPETDDVISSQEHKIDLDYLDIDLSAWKILGDHARQMEHQRDAAMRDLLTEKQENRQQVNHLITPFDEDNRSMKRALEAVWACWTNAGELSVAVKLVRPHVQSM